MEELRVVIDDVPVSFYPAGSALPQEALTRQHEIAPTWLRPGERLKACTGAYGHVDAEDGPHLRLLVVVDVPSSRW